jgi:hypothetical protein
MKAKHLRCSPAFTIAASVASCLALLVTPALAQDCVSNLGGRRLASIAPGFDGVREVNYVFRDESLQQQETPPEQIQDAIIDASAEWNSAHTTTGVRFLPQTGSEPINLVIAPTSEPGACLHIDAFNGILSYSSTFAAWAVDNPEEAAAAMMHEFGHYMG